MFYSFTKFDNFQSLEENIYDDSIVLLMESVLKIINDKTLKSTPQKISDGKQYYKMSIKNLKESKKNFNEYLKKL